MSSAKEYLRQVKLLDIQIDSRLHELYHLKDMVRKITTTLSPVPSSGSGNLDRLGDSVAKIIDLQDEINRDVDRFVDLKKDIMAMTEGLTDADQVNVIHKRYFEYKTWEQIACEMHMSYRNVCYIHGKALLAVAKLMKFPEAESKAKKDGKAHWESVWEDEKEEDGQWNEYVAWFECSHCGHTQEDQSSKCPNCHSEMDCDEFIECDE